MTEKEYRLLRDYVDARRHHARMEQETREAFQRLRASAKALTRDMEDGNYLYQSASGVCLVVISNDVGVHLIEPIVPLPQLNDLFSSLEPNDMCDLTLPVETETASDGLAENGF